MVSVNVKQGEYIKRALVHKAMEYHSDLVDYVACEENNSRMQCTDLVSEFYKADMSKNFFKITFVTKTNEET